MTSKDYGQVLQKALKTWTEAKHMETARLTQQPGFNACPDFTSRLANTGAPPVGVPPVHFLDVILQVLAASVANQDIGLLAPTILKPLRRRQAPLEVCCISSDTKKLCLHCVPLTLRSCKKWMFPLFEDEHWQELGKRRTDMGSPDPNTHPSNALTTSIKCTATAIQEA